MGIYKDKEVTKDGKQWFFKIRYDDIDGSHKQKRSGRFATKKEAEEAEFNFKLRIHNHENQSTMTIEEMMNLFIDYKKDKVRETTMYNYGNKKNYIKPLYNIKLKEFNIIQFERWKDYINSTHLSTKYKNDIYKFLKSILNYATKWYEFNFAKVYPKMTNFNNPNEIKKEMLFYTYEEFQQFISAEDNIKWKTIFQILYYCGLRRGELLGLQWKDINFTRNTMSISKQITARSGTIKNFHFCVPKTKSSIRTIPFGKVLRKSLEMCKIEASKVNGFTDEYFVCGDAFPLSPNALSDHKKALAEKAGVKVIRTHDFRHSCASLLIDRGSNVTLVAKYLGHTKIEETLNTYSHMYNSTLNDIIKRFDDLDK
jgi:integrase